ncbi:MAG: hypothetical protein JW759_00845 [Candidatus Coatesbacteria bacterium]|nr:hypothetical protein [Candidatus Coatesbacteria bacterium]
MMAGKFLFGEWRFVGRLMRKRGLLLIVVLLLQAGLLVSLSIVLSATKVTDTVPGQASLRLEGQSLCASFSVDKKQPAWMLEGVAEAVLVLALPEHPDGLSIRVQVLQVGPDNLALRSLNDAAAGLKSALSGGRLCTSGAFPAQLVIRKRTLLSAIIQDRKNAKEGRGAASLFQF